MGENYFVWQRKVECHRFKHDGETGQPEETKGNVYNIDANQ